MKVVKIVLLLIILFIFCSSISSGLSNITGFSISNLMGMLTYNTTGLVIMIDANAPDVDIIYPLNSTYNYKGDITLEINYSDISDISAILYNLDNSDNTSINGNITFDTNE